MGCTVRGAPLYCHPTGDSWAATTRHPNHQPTTRHPNHQFKMLPHLPACPHLACLPHLPTCPPRPHTCHHPAQNTPDQFHYTPKFWPKPGLKRRFMATPPYSIPSQPASAPGVPCAPVPLHPCAPGARSSCSSTAGTPHPSPKLNQPTADQRPTVPDPPMTRRSSIVDCRGGGGVQSRVLPGVPGVLCDFLR